MKNGVSPQQEGERRFVNQTVRAYRGVEKLRISRR
jgi:hypothetical protein